MLILLYFLEKEYEQIYTALTKNVIFLTNTPIKPFLRLME